MRDMMIVRRIAVALAATLTVAAAAAPAADACFFDINSHGSIVLIPPRPQKQLHFDARHRVALRPMRDARHHVALAPMREGGLRD
jgi:hypothetical protein